MQISNTPYNIRQIGQTDAGNTVTSTVNKQREGARIDDEKNAQSSHQSNNSQKNRLAYDEKAIALIEQQSTQVATNQQSPNNNSATDYDTPSEQNLSAVAAYESIGNLDQRDKIKQVFGVDLLA